LSMPEESLNYTITVENGTLWAKIDGTYPMHLMGSNGSVQLPMRYPTPPNTNNMHVYLDNAELHWSNYSLIDPTDLHSTDIGDWQQIYAVISPAAPDFVMGIHYEHPIEVINGTYTVLYDLNIITYLSPSSPNSTAHFTIRIEANCSAVNVYTTGLNGTWSPKTYSIATEENGTRTIKFDITSEYGKPLWGDIAITLPNAQVPELPSWAILPLLLVITVIIVSVSRKRILKKP
jgi:hypothetical protein